MVDQSPIGRTPRSNPVTYIKAFDLIRGLFASTREAEKRGYTAGHFSFNIPGGRCETCQGDGTVTVEMQFLADVELVCDECKGTRYKSGILEIRYNGLNIHEVLQLTVREAMEFFHATPRLVQRLKVLDDVGLGYLRLGQSATTLSGGEAQRVKLAAHLAASSVAGTLFIFDEPTTGLHFDDIAKLLAAFQRLIENGGSLVIIEHNLDVIKAADWVIDLGPEGGGAAGTSWRRARRRRSRRSPESHTGHYLRQVFVRLGRRREGMRSLLFCASSRAARRRSGAPDGRPIISQMDGGTPDPPGFEHVSGRDSSSCRVSGYTKIGRRKGAPGVFGAGLRPQGRAADEIYKNEMTTEVGPQDKEWMPKIATEVPIPPLVASGAYKIVVKVEDVIAKTTAELAVPFQVRGKDVEPSER